MKSFKVSEHCIKRFDALAHCERVLKDVAYSAYREQKSDEINGNSHAPQRSDYAQCIPYHQQQVYQREDPNRSEMDYTQPDSMQIQQPEEQRQRLEADTLQPENE